MKTPLLILAILLAKVALAQNCTLKIVGDISKTKTCYLMVFDKTINKKSIKYKLRDWLFSRQRYWGEPFPIIFVNDDDGDGEYAKALDSYNAA